MALLCKIRILQINAQITLFPLLNKKYFLLCGVEFGNQSIPTVLTRSVKLLLF